MILNQYSVPITIERPTRPEDTVLHIEIQRAANASLRRSMMELDSALFEDVGPRLLDRWGRPVRQWGMR